MQVETSLPIPSVSVDAVIARRAAALECVERVSRALFELEMIASAPNSDIKAPRLYHENHAAREEFSTGSVMKWIDREVWNSLLHRSGMWSFMDARAREEWRRSYEEWLLPAVTKENIESAFAALQGQRASFVARGVADIFRRLSRHHVTNHGDRFTRKVILPALCSVWKGDWLMVNQNATDALDDLDRTLHVLRGLPAPEHQTRSAFRLVNLATSGEHRTMVAEFPYFTVRAFKRGTGHVIFRHDVDVDRLNAVLAAESGGSEIGTRARV